MNTYTIFHFLSIVIGIFLAIGVLSGKVRGGTFDPVTGIDRVSPVATVVPLVAGLVIIISAIGGLVT